MRVRGGATAFILDSALQQVDVDVRAPADHLLELVPPQQAQGGGRELGHKTCPYSLCYSCAFVMQPVGLQLVTVAVEVSPQYRLLNNVSRCKLLMNVGACPSDECNHTCAPPGCSSTSDPPLFVVQ